MNKSWSDRRFCPCKRCKFVSWDGGPILWAKGPTWTRNRQKSGPILRVGPKLRSSQPRCLRLVVSYLKVTCLPILLFPIFIQWSTQYGQLFKKPKKKKDKKLTVCSNTLLYSYKWLDESYFININNLWDNVCCAAYFVAGTDIGKFTMKTVDDVRTLNKSVHFRPSCNCLNINELASVWEKKIGRTLPRVTVTEDDLLAAAGGGVTLFTFIL